MSEPTQNETPEQPRRKGGCLKRLVVGGVLILVVGGVAIRVAAPYVIQSQAQSIGSKVLGVPVTVGDVSLGLIEGRATISNVTVAQPAGFSATPLLSIGRIEADVSTGALLGGAVHVENVEVADTKVQLERNAAGAVNWQVLVENMKKAQPPAKEPVAKPTPAPAPASEPVPIRLDRLAVTGTALTFDDKGPGTPGTVGLGLTEFSLQNVVFDPKSKEPAWISVALKGGELSGPKGAFEAAKPVEFGAVTVDADLTSLMNGTNHVRSIRIEQPSLALEQRGDVWNLQQIGTNLRNFAPAGEEPKEAQPAATESTIDSAIGQATDALTAAQEAKDAASKPADPTPTPKPVPFRLDQFEMANARLSLNREGGSGGRREFQMSKVTMDLRDVKSPYTAGDTMMLNLRAHPYRDESKLTLKTVGEWMSTDPGRALAGEIDLQGTPLRELATDFGTGESVPEVDLFAKGKVDWDDEKLSATITAHVKGLKGDSGPMGGLGNMMNLAKGGADSVDAAFQILRKPDTDETIAVVLEMQVDLAGKSDKERREILMRESRRAFMAAAQRAMADKAASMTDAARRAAEEAAAEARRVAEEAAAAATKAAEDAVNQVRDTAGDAAKQAEEALKKAGEEGKGLLDGVVPKDSGGGLGGFLGGSKPKPTPTPKK